MQTYNDDKCFFNLSSDVYFKHFFSNEKVLAVFLSKLWNKNENLSSKALVSSLLYFVVAYLIH